MFTGREYDKETKLYYYRARHYSPHIGRFLQRDPLQIDDENAYTYCYNDPVNYLDPLGLTSLRADPGWFGNSFGEFGDIPTADYPDADMGYNPIQNKGIFFNGVSATGLGGFNTLPGINITRVGIGKVCLANYSKDGDSAKEKQGNSNANNTQKKGFWDRVRDVVDKVRNSLKGWRSGRELSVKDKDGKTKFRISPLGNKKSKNPSGRWPHYHRRIINPNTGDTAEGGGIKWHRPWEGGW